MKGSLCIKALFTIVSIMLFSDSFAQYYSAISDSECEVTIVEEKVQSLVIPSEVYIGQKKYLVTRIREDACQYNNDLISVVLPNTIKSIGRNAFFFCNNLVSINIPGSVVSIESGAFWGCSSLKSVNIPNSLSTIESGVFGRTGLTSVVIPNSITTIGDQAFSNCSSLTSITIPGSVTIIGERAFIGCSSLTTIDIPSSVTSIGGGVFSGCTGLTSINIPSSVTAIEDETFYGCSSLHSIKIPISVTTIGNYAFQNCSTLASVNIPKSVKEIGCEAFRNCSSLTSIDIPKSVTSCGDFPFSGCHSLTKVSIDCTNIGNVFSWMDSIREVVLGSSVRSIGAKAFENCYGLQSIIIPNSVTSIGEFAFNGCRGLASITISNSITSIEKATFQGCSALTSITIPPNVTTIGIAAFQGCKSLSSIIGLDNITTISEGAFADCESLKSIDLPVSLQKIDHYAFRYDEDLKVIYLHSEEPPECDDLGFFHYNNKVLYVPIESVEKYKGHDVWGKFNVFTQMDLYRRHRLGDYWNPNVDVRGVTADGLSSVVVSLPVTQTSAIPDFNTLKVKFELDGKECTDEKVTGKIGTIGWVLTDYSWGFMYTAPEDFPDDINGNDYTLDITLYSEENGLVAVLGGAQINVYRPGVILLHGLNSNSDCFKAMTSYLHHFGGYEDFQLLNANYNASNMASFDDNTHTYNVLSNNANKLYCQLADHGIVSTSYDIVAHSMGGLLARKYIQETRHKENVNRIITMNTPHSGSQLSDTYKSVSTFLDVADIAEIVKVLPAFKKLYEKFKIIGRNWGAIEDLSPSSNAIKKLNGLDMLTNAKGVPVHAFCSTLDTKNQFSHGEVPIIDKQIKWYDKISLGYFFMKTKEELNKDELSILNLIFEQDANDGIVSFTSQRGGVSGLSWSLYSDEYRGHFGMSSSAHHCNITDIPEVFVRIDNLLHTPKKSEYFADEFQPEDLSKIKTRTRSIEEIADFKTAKESQFIKIMAEKEDTARILKVSISGSDDLWSNIVFTELDDDFMFSGFAQKEYRFRIPERYEGDFMVYALGRTNDDALVCDSVKIHYDSDVTLEYMYFEDWPSVTMVEGQRLELNVLAGWSNGEKRIVTPNYSTNKDGILDIDGSLLTARGAGECQLIAHYGDLTDTLTVKVIAAVPDGINRIRTDKPIVKYANGVLTVVANKPISGNLAVDIYDLTGKHFFQKRQKLSLRDGELATFDLSSLTQQLYIVRITGAMDAIFKFYKK